MDALDKRKTTSPMNGKNGGVKTDEGKAISSQNALKHGIFSRFNTSFDDITFEDAYAAFAEEFGDQTTSRKVLISHLAALQIRLRRCARFETDYIRELLHPPKYEKKLIRKGLEFDTTMFDEYETVLVDPGERMTLPPECLSRLENLYSKYETQFMTQFCRIVEILTRSAN